MKTYETSTAWAMSEEDNWENGCLRDTEQVFDYDVKFEAKSLKELLVKIKEHFGVENEDMLLNSCDVKGRLDIQRLEDEQGCKLYGYELEKWKHGKKKAWLVCYSYKVYEVDRKEVDLNGNR